MTLQGKLFTLLTMSACFAQSAESSLAADLLSKSALNRMGVRRYWQTDLPLLNNELVQRAVLLDDNVYLLTDANRAYAVHALTGILRWGAAVAEPGQSVRGPTHSSRYVLFTAPASVRAFDRRTGEILGEPRKLRGAIIEVIHDTATISIGKVHGVRAEDLLDVVRLNSTGEPVGEPLAQLQITVVEQRQSKGRLIRKSRSIPIRSGDRVSADVVLPLESIKLPFAASSPAVADGKDLFVGAANQRFYSLRLLGGFQNWQIMAPQTLSTTPVLRWENIVKSSEGKVGLQDIRPSNASRGRARRVLYFGGQDGRIVSAFTNTSLNREKNWIYETEGPIFSDILVAPRHVYAASNDRSLYCLNRLTGERVWQKRFDNPPALSPRLAGGRVYQQVPAEGLFVLDAETGEQRWRRPEGGHCMAQFGEDVYLFQDTGTHALIRLEAETGTPKSKVEVDAADFAVANSKNQLILLISQQGQMMCIRPKSAPPLKPEQLADVLRNDRRAQAVARLTAKERERVRNEEKSRLLAEARSKPKVDLDFLDEDNWLASRSKLRPIGGSGLVDVEDDEPVSEDDEDVDEEDTDEDEDEIDEEDEDEDEEDDEDWGEDDEEEDDEEDDE